MRSAFTLVELLVVIAVIGILLALLLPAVLYAREAARKTTCRNNLKQIALATHGYVSAQHCFPPFMFKHWPPYSDGGLYWSTHVALLPYLERDALYDHIMREGDAVWLQWVGIPTFGCPSDGRGGFPGMVSYGRCLGSDQSDRQETGIFVTGEFEEVIHVGDVQDGLSNTAMYGEILRGSQDRDDPRRAIWGITARPTEGEGENYAALCRHLPESTTDNLSGGRGSEWYSHSGGNSGYNHILPPNTRSCAWDRDGDGTGLTWHFGSFNSASDHAGGVHFALADGSVRFASNSVDLVVWRAVGTRYGGEVVTAF